MVDRRAILKAACLSTISSALPNVAFADVASDSRFVLVILRGGVDGLALAPPYGDGLYRKVRGELALPGPGNDGGVLKLDGLFGLHPSLSGTHGFFADGEALLVHAVASPYRERSHFDGQDVLESGASGANALRNGWLNRALAPLGGSLDKNNVAIAMAHNTPLVLRGDYPVTSWAPSKMPDTDDSTLERLQDLYADDDFFATRLAQARKLREIANSTGDTRRGLRRGDAQQIRSTMQATARFLTAPGGPRIAVLEAGGWDTHANQGAENGQLANRLAQLDAGIVEFRKELGSNWRQTVVMVVTEFGRTARVNGTRGTDHGTATAALLVGGAVSGGRIVADWPGLRPGDLYEGRDLRPTGDLRSLFKGALAEHLALPQGVLDREVFPDSSSVRPFENLIRS